MADALCAQTLKIKTLDDFLIILPVYWPSLWIFLRNIWNISKIGCSFSHASSSALFWCELGSYTSVFSVQHILVPTFELQMYHSLWLWDCKSCLEYQVILYMLLIFQIVVQSNFILNQSYSYVLT